MEAQCTEFNSLPNELWIRSFAYLNEKDLFNLANVSRNFLSISSTDELWQVHCYRRWKGKQNVKRFMKKDAEIGRVVNDGRLGSDVMQVINLLQYSTTINVGEGNISSHSNLIYKPKSWKESWILAEIDSRRTLMTREELVYFKWKLIYDGSPSQMGLRQFSEDGTYWSPYMGTCQWQLNYKCLMFAGMALQVERNADRWGWVIGRGERTVYHSVECEE